jgi:hypothetical protein
MRPTFEVVCRSEVHASAPELAATVARDMMLDPDTPLHVDVHPMEYVKDAEDWFPDSNRGWSVWFSRPVRQVGWPQPASAVHPCECIEWTISRY